ncbi:type III restriction-modification system endonuclease [Escherichia coli]|uniref:type III restriction-modification system endonuclease n=1 Tax=Escherichia coli TaxID=562 RepID=UPI0005A6B04A|nr:type III restriction-modification system endonuclease [Escherichia coli]EFI0263512.1 type III restriction-modification system endonuclease [Escherichia coli]EFQ5436085.1 type III restriction-modification system endonuclease [Escherichia coli]EHI6404469.1 type III restriction-modification system endonuclease [Escherichia coli]EKX1230610.1 type III restriction-modification system endonuclease [Escherichia coli]EKX3438836.1 type III restriction-modification system endonuclease [Escherichia col
MSKGFTFEKNLPHQKAAVDSVMNVFVSAIPHQTGHVAIHLLANPELNLSEQQYYNNIKNVQEFNGIDHLKDNYDAKSNVIDVSMETGTGKTYTYTKTIFDLNKSFGINKFIIIVPTLSVKAGTVNFLKSDALKEHFRDDYERELKTYVVESQKSSGKNTKSYMPQAIHDFVEASNLNKRYIHVLVINSGMINSKSLTDSYDVGLLDNQFDTPFAALGAVKPFIIIDEPHKFPTGKKTWENIEKFNAQYIIRYGATFSEGYKNLVYRLTAVDAFNEDLVKGIDAYIEDIVGDGNANLRFVKSDGKEATFELNENNNKKTFKLAKGESLSRTHSAIHDLTLDVLNKSTAVLSNGIELKIGSSINPYSYDQTLADNMMRKAVKEHFKLEKEYLTQRPRIKPLTLFFIDDIEGYRDGNDIAGSLKTRFEEYVLAEANELLKIEKDEFYRNYLEKTVKDISSVHGGYFSKDNSDKDDKVEQEITEILHDKELLLSLENPRRFIFSKWTLREGWDNPNVFQICKLRSSGSTTSKLQEVGRGLRLPVNEYMCRVKDRNFTLNYYVDFTEKDFVDSLVKEINDSSFKETVPGKFTQELKDKILSQYPELSSRTLLNEIFDDEIIDDNDNFKDSDAYSRLKARYPAAFPAGVKPGKIKKASDGKRRTKMRVGKFSELKELWDLINQKVVIEYKIKSEREFLSLFRAFMLEEADRFTKSGAHTRIERIYIHNDTAMSKSILSVDEDNFPKINTMSYREFLDKLSQTIFVKHDTMHKVFCDIKDIINITEYLNIQTIRKIKSGFSKYLLNNSFSKFSLGYNVISGTVHPTKFTNADGGYLADVLSSDLGVLQDNTSPPLDSYLFEEVFYDSELEKLNMTEGEVRSVIVFTKIPKNSIKIPVAGGYTYSPDFAYVVNTSKGDYLNLIIETKNVDGKRELRHEERDKIKHAQKLFEQISKSIKITFMTQFSGDKIHDLIKKLTQ